MEGIREFEKNILTEMDFIDRYLNIELKFIKNNSDKILKCDKINSVKSVLCRVLKL